MKTLPTLTAVLAAIAFGGVMPAGALSFAAQAQDAGAASDTAGATSDSPSQTTAETPEAASDAAVEEMQIGNPEADVTVIEYASFTCPHCRNFHDTVFDRLKQDYIDTGKINFIYREVYFDRYGLWAGMVARCGGADRYFGISDLLYEQQQDWVKGEPAEIAGNLRRIGKTAGLTDDQLDTCLGDADKAKALVETYQKNAEADEITSTPSFVINGTKYSNMNYEEFSAILDEKLGQ